MFARQHTNKINKQREPNMLGKYTRSHSVLFQWSVAGKAIFPIEIMKCIICIDIQSYAVKSKIN